MLVDGKVEGLDALQHPCRPRHVALVTVRLEEETEGALCEDGTIPVRMKLVTSQINQFTVLHCMDNPA